MRALLVERTHALHFGLSPPMPAKLAAAIEATDRNANPSKMIMAAKRPDLRR